jgi:AraC-type DNA-binding domain-containing proteins
MSLYNFETVNYDKKYPANVFTTYIGYSKFHCHYEYELCLVLKGKIKITYDSHTMTYCANDIVLINSRVVHSVQDEEDNLCVVIQLDPTLFESNGENTGNIRRFFLDSVRDELQPHKEYSYFALRAAKIAYESLSENKNSYFRGRYEIYHLVADLIEYVEYDIRSNVQPVEEDMKLIMSFFDYVKEHLNSENVIKDATKQLGVSEKTLQRYLKKYVGFSIKEVLDWQRLAVAKHLLQETNKTIDYIIDQCRFGSEKTFYRLFKKEMSMTPTEFRNKTSKLRKGSHKQGYLSFDRQEVLKILQNILEV